jgi:hypothetical protein
LYDNPAQSTSPNATFQIYKNSSVIRKASFSRGDTTIEDNKASLETIPFHIGRFITMNGTSDYIEFGFNGTAYVTGSPSHGAALATANGSSPSQGTVMRVRRVA